VDAARDAMERAIARDFDKHLAGLAGRPVPRNAMMFFETVAASPWLAADERVDHRRRLEAAVRELADDRSLDARVRKRVVKLLALIQDGPRG
jgi:hypothetical protein